MVAAHGVTHPGPVRPRNEDAMVVDVGLGLFAVADGMGGHNAGEVASALALEVLHDFLRRSAQDLDHTWPFGLESTLDFHGNRLRTAVKLANRQVFRESESRARFSGMGTTLVAVLVDGDSAVLCGIGDSRIYAVRREGCERLTRDHTFVEMLLSQNPDIDRDALARHPMRGVLTSVLGAQDDIDVTVAALAMEGTDRLVLCSDGVHSALDDSRISAIVGQAANARSAAEGLVTEALERAGDDNLTAVVIAREP